MGKNNPLGQIKSIAYKLAEHPGAYEGTLTDLIRHAKYKICEARGLPYFDSLENYTDEETLIEYYAILFSKDPEAKKAFAAEMDAGDDSHDDFADWAEAEIEKGKTEKAEVPVEAAEDFEFTPEGLGD